MDKKTVFVKTDKGESEASGQSDVLFGDVKRILHLVDDESTVGEITKRAPPSLRDALNDMLQELVDGGYIRDMRAPAVEVQKAPLKMSTPVLKMATPKFAAPSRPAPPPPAAPTPPVAPPKAVTPAKVAPNIPSLPPMSMPDMSMPSMGSAVPKAEEPAKTNNSKSDLDFSFIMSGSATAPSNKSQMEANIEAAAKAKQDADIARSKAAQADQSQEAAAKAKQKAYEEAKQRAQIEMAARARIEAEAKLKQETLKAQAESASAKARIEAEVRARIEAETRIKQEAEAIRLKAEKEAEKLRMELEAAKARAEQEAKNRIEAEVRAKVEAEARIKREAEAERLRLEKELADLALARVKAEAEIRLREEAELRVRAEVETRMKAEALARQTELRSLQQGDRSTAPAQEPQIDPAEKLRQSFVESFAQNKTKQGVSSTGSFKLDKFSFVTTGNIPVLTGQPNQRPGAPTTPSTQAPVLPGGGSKVKAAIEQRAQREAEAQRIKNEQEAARIKAEQDEAARIKAEQESIRLKAEHEAYRLKVQQDEERAKAEAEARKLTDQQSKQWEEGQRRAAAQEQAEKERLAAQSAAAKVKHKPARAARKPLPAGKIIGALLVLVLLAIAALPYILPMDEYIAPVKQEISAQIKQPVNINKISFELLPLPKLVLHAFSAGNASELIVDTVEINFDFSALFAPVKSISKIELKNVTLAGATLEKSLPWIQASGGIDKYPVARMELKNVRINSNQIKLPVLHGRVDFDAQGKFTHADLKSEDNKLSLELKPQQNRLQMEINMLEGNLPVLPGIKFNDLSMNAVLDSEQMHVVISDFFAHIHGGTLTGKGLLSWMNGWKLQGQINAKSLDLKRMFPAFGISGELLGNVNLSMQSLALSQLDKDPRIEGTFEVKNGVIQKIDFDTVARFGARPGVAGHTNFSEMSGTIKADSDNQRLFFGKIALTAANVTGVLDIDSSQQLAGKFMVDIKGQNVPLQLSGSTTNPNLQSGR